MRSRWTRHPVHETEEGAAWYWILLIGLGVAGGYSAHPREHVKRIEDGKLISPKYQYLFQRGAITGATKKGERQLFVGE